MSVFALLQILNILAKYGYAAALNGVEGLHRVIEAFKHTYAVRMNLGDPDFVDVSSVVADMLDPKFAASLQSQIVDNATFPPEYYGGRYTISVPKFNHACSCLKVSISQHMRFFYLRLS